MIGQTLDGRYRVVRSLETGGFGQTFVAEDTRRPGNPACVVKHLQPACTDPDFLQVARRLFHREAATLEQLGHHDQIPRLLAFFEQDQEFYLVQEFVEGNPLTTELGPGRRWSQPQTIALLKELLTILEFIHSQGVIHRDLKPDNIIRRRWDHKLVLVDFGAVKQIRTQISRPGIPIHTTVAVGTPGYMPSEQGQGQPRPSSDLYALGMIGIQALTGISPSQLRQDEDGELVWQDQVQVTDEFAAFLAKLVRYYFKLRYQTAGEALQALMPIEHAVPTTPLTNKSNAMGRSRQQNQTFNPVEPTQVVYPSAPPVSSPGRKRPKAASRWQRAAVITGLGVIAATLGAVALTLWGPQLKTLLPLPMATTVPDEGIKLLQQAQAEAAQTGNLEQAIQIAETIASNSTVYAEAQTLIQDWRWQWQQQQALFARAQAAFQASQWKKARDLAYQLPRNPYWDFRANPIYYQAKRKIAELEEKSQPSPSPTPSPPAEATPGPSVPTTETPAPTPSPDKTPTESPGPQSPPAAVPQPLLPPPQSSEQP